MPNPDLAKLFADNAHALPHPSGTPVRLVQLDTSTLPPGLKDEVESQHANTLGEIGAAQVHLMETNGWVAIRATELDELQTKAAAFDGIRPPIASIYCSACGDKLLDLNITRPERINTRATTLRSVRCQCPEE